MRLYSICRKCKTEISIKPKEVSRYDLARAKNADEFNERCPECGFVNSFHVNDVRASSSNVLLLIIAGIILGISVLIWLFLRDSGILLVSTLPAVIIGIIYTNQNNAVATFNKHLLRRK